MKIEPGTLANRISREESDVDQMMNDIESMVSRFRDLSGCEGKRISIYPGDKWYLTIRLANMNAYEIEDWYLGYTRTHGVFQEKPADEVYIPDGGMVSPVAFSMIPFVFEVLAL